MEREDIYLGEDLCGTGGGGVRRSEGSTCRGGQGQQKVDEVGEGLELVREQ